MSTAAVPAPSSSAPATRAAAAPAPVAKAAAAPAARPTAPGAKGSAGPGKGAPAASPWLARLQSTQDWIIPVAAVAMLFVMLVPLPGMVLDFLLTISITASVLVLLTAIQIRRPVEFSVFPSLILLLTLMRLSLDLASTRRILLHGSDGPSAAGHVIEAFGQFVVGGNYIVGFVLFLALTAIQYLVISHGAVRTAEVTARFNLDAMPGKQMAIDADLNAGLINEAQARVRRAAITAEAEFCGAMDGAARFSQRDSLATILIMAINIIAGFLIGVFQQGIPFQDALKTYTILTVGDGLVAILPSLLVSVAGGIVVTRATSRNSLGENVSRQILASPRLLRIAGGVLFALGLIPGLPKIAFFSLGGLLFFVASKLKNEPVLVDAEEAALAASKKGAKDGAPAAIDGPEGALKLDVMTLEVGAGLVPIVDAKQGGQLLTRIKTLRKTLAQQLGFLVPSIHITDNLSLREGEYVVLLRGAEIGRAELRRGYMMAIASDPNAPPLPGIETRDPAFNAPARWISPSDQAKAIAAGYAVVDTTSVLMAHLSELIRSHSSELLTRSESKRLIDRLTDSHPKLAEELIPKLLSLGEVQKVLQQLLRESVSIRDMGSILEALADTAATNKNQIALVESARQALGRSLIRPILDESGTLQVVTLDAPIEEECIRAANAGAMHAGSAVGVGVARKVLDGLRASFGESVAEAPPVVLCASPGRFYLRRVMEPFLPKLVVISPSEIPPAVSVKSLGVVR